MFTSSIRVLLRMFTPWHDHALVIGYRSMTVRHGFEHPNDFDELFPYGAMALWHTLTLNLPPGCSHHLQPGSREAVSFSVQGVAEAQRKHTLSFEGVCSFQRLDWPSRCEARRCATGPTCACTRLPGPTVWPLTLGMLPLHS